MYERFNKKPLIIVAGSYFAGKSRLLHEACEADPNGIKKLVTSTTREMRGQEQNAVDYYFVSEQQFEHLIQHNQMVEWVKQDEHFYGLTKNEVLEGFTKTHHRVAIVTMDSIGVANVKNNVDGLGERYLEHFSVVHFVKLYIDHKVAEERAEQDVQNGARTKEGAQKRLDSFYKEKEALSKVLTLNDGDYLLNNSTPEHLQENVRFILNLAVKVTA